MRCSQAVKASDFDSDIREFNSLHLSHLDSRCIMKYRVVKSEEYYGRNINYIDRLVLLCNECGHVCTCKNESDIEKAKVEHTKLKHTDSKE